MGLESKAGAATSAPASGFDDQALIRQIVGQGSQTHFRLLVERHQNHVFELVCSVLGPRHRTAAEETSQEVFIKIYRKLSAFRGESSFSTWAYRVAYNTALDKLRVLKRQQAQSQWSEEQDQRPDNRPGPCARAAAEQDDAKLRAAVEQLPEIYQTLVHLHYWRGMTVVEIATLLESKTGTIKSYLHRARARLAKIIGEPA